MTTCLPEIFVHNKFFQISGFIFFLFRSKYFLFIINIIIIIFIYKKHEQLIEIIFSSFCLN